MVFTTRYVKQLSNFELVADRAAIEILKVKHGVMFDIKESEGTRRRHQVDTVVEGIGINRITTNIELALPVIGDAFRCAPQFRVPYVG